MNNDSLWGDEFVVPKKEPKEKVKEVVAKVRKPKQYSVVDSDKQLKSKNISVKEKLVLINEEVKRVLGKQIDNCSLIKTRGDFNTYIDLCIKNGCVAIDTETNNSLDPLTCKLMGLCLYTPGFNQVYIPVNHVNVDTGERLDWQLTEDDINLGIKRLVEAKTFSILHNAKFDYQVIKCTCGIEIRIDWDTLIDSKIIDENEASANLKQQYIDKIDPEQEKYDIEHLFSGVEYAVVDPEIFKLYAATDSMMTYKLYLWQKKFLNTKESRGLKKLSEEVETPCIKVVAEMELNGIEVDQEYAKRLSDKYHKKLEELGTRIHAEISKYEDKIAAWRLTSDAQQPAQANKPTGKTKNEALEEYINFSSPIQLAILLYDVMGVKPVSKKTPRGTGEDILEKIDLPICKLILEQRGLLKLINAFIDSLPQMVNPKDGRIHCHFNQYGAATGRFSSSDPNLQQIPSHLKEIRMMFKARDGYTLVGSDFSQQEPRLLAFYSQDENMINAYKQGKDLYATIASGVYHNDYWDNMEHHQDGSPNPEGKKRRSSCKSLLLGIMYGRGTASIAEQIGSTKEEAQEIVDNFYKSFPKVEEWTKQTEIDAKKNGYVEDYFGRRRRLPDIQLEPYEIKYVDEKRDTIQGFNPILGCQSRFTTDNRITYYRNKLSKIKYNKEYEKIKAEALADGIEIHNNNGFIAQAERQCVNARIQGGAATMTKIAMIKLYNDKQLNDLGFKLLIGVHDELIGECPVENADKVAERLTYVMKTCVNDIIDVPFKCDADVADHWYANDYQDVLKSEYESLKSKLGEDKAFTNIVEEHTELEREQLYSILYEGSN